MFTNLSVKARLFVTLGLLSLIMLAVGLLGLRALARSNDGLQAVFHENLLPITWVGSMSANSREVITKLDEAIVSGDPADLAASQALAKHKAVENNAMWEKYKATQVDAAEKRLAEECEQTRKAYRGARDEVIKELSAGNIDAARSKRGSTLKAKITEMVAAAQRLQDLKMKQAEAAAKAAEERYAGARAVSIAAIILGVALGVVLGALLVKSMLRSLSTAIGVSERIAAGELGRPIEIQSNDEFGRLLTALREMDRRLSTIVTSVRVGADAVGSAARQISNGNDDLSQRTQEQASALEETASSMEQMAATVKQNADNARHASQLAAGAREQADHGGDVVTRAIGAMSEINEASRRIADIIDVIEELSFQTNLLALNAAVEAARAGEQGRGFAVVASEVRSLAQRSSTAAKEIRGLISDSVDKVKAGSQLVDASGRSLTEIVASVKQVADMVIEISRASEEQSSGIEQVNTAMTQMDSVTQQNAALVEEAAAASKAMEHQAQDLVQRISFFRVDERAMRSMNGQSQVVVGEATSSSAKHVLEQRRAA